MKYLIIVFFCLLNLVSAIAQPPPGTGGNTTPTVGLPEFEVIDTSYIFYFYADNPDQEYPFQDSLLHNFQQYDPARIAPLEYANLGNLGTALRPLVYAPRKRNGFDVGFHQFDLYKTHTHQIRYYNIEAAYSDFYYSQGGTQNDALFNAKFSRNFANGLNFAIDFNRLSQLEEIKTLDQDGQYQNPFGRNTSLGMGFWYHSPKGRYDSFLSFASNSHAQDDNGGISTDTFFTKENLQLYSVPIYLDDAFTRHREREYGYTQYYRLNRASDSIKTAKRAITVYHHLLYTDGKYKFYDTTPIDDSTFYENLLLDNRGLRNYVEHRKVENAFALRTSKLRDPSKTNVKSQRDLLEVGINHKIHWVHQEPLDTVLQNLQLTAKWNFTPNERLKLKTSAHYGLLANRGDYQVDGQLFFNFKKIGNLKAQLLQQLYRPSLLEYRNFISQEEIWNNDFKKTLETNLSVTYQLPTFQFEVSGHYHLLNNYIYYDTLATPQQEGRAMNILQLHLRKDFKFGGFHLDNFVVLQTTTEDRIRFPNFYARHSLYWQGRVFKKVMLMRVGLDLRMNSNFYADRYQPLTGQFFLQDEEEILFYPAVDAFLNFKVSRFRFYIKIENLTSLLTEDIFYQVAQYPIQEGNLRFGISWRMSN